MTKSTCDAAPASRGWLICRGAVLRRFPLRVLAIASLLAATAGGCADAQAPARPGGVLQAYALERRDGQALDLPASLREISGLAMTVDGRLFAHDDETADVHQLDPATGQVLKSFAVGRPRVRADFEGIAIAGRRFFLMTSDGVLYEFEEGAADEHVDYRVIDTRLGTRCELEGLDYDAQTHALLLACKTPRVRTLRGRLAVVAYSLRTEALDTTPRLLMPLDFLREAGHRAELSPSGIAVHPHTGTYFIVAAREHLLVEIARDGQVLGVRELARGAHPQAEGIAFLSDGTLLISDERPRRGLLTRYPAPAPDREDPD